jgi:electron transfer flavoprotein alpha subunit
VGLLACVEGESEFLAPMVTEAQYAVIGDMHEVVAAMNVELRRRKE